MKRQNIIAGRERVIKIINKNRSNEILLSHEFIEVCSMNHEKENYLKKETFSKTTCYNERVKRVLMFADYLNKFWSYIVGGFSFKLVLFIGRKPFSSSLAIIQNCSNSVAWVYKKRFLNVSIFSPNIFSFKSYSHATFMRLDKATCWWTVKRRQKKKRSKAKVKRA